jgi:hypothetical protein
VNRRLPPPAAYDAAPAFDAGLVAGAADLMQMRQQVGDPAELPKAPPIMHRKRRLARRFCHGAFPLVIHGIGFEEANMLISLAGDLRVCNVVSYLPIATHSATSPARWPASPPRP